MIVAHLTSPPLGTELFLHVYGDGVALFTLIDSVECFDSLDDYHPESTVQYRHLQHQAILRHTHALSPKVQKTVAGLRGLLGGSPSRITASPEWENKGLSYVMSFYFVDTDIACMEQEGFQDKLIHLLFPSSRIEALLSTKVNNVIIDGKSFRKKLRDSYLTTLLRNFETLPHVHTCASWSNFLVIGKLDDDLVKEYWTMERDLQHTWFYAYITDKLIEHSLQSVSTSTPAVELDWVDKALTGMMLRMTRYEGIANSTAHERDFRLVEALRETSRLRVLTEAVDKKASLLRRRYEWLLAEKRLMADRRIQMILFVLAFIVALSNYELLAKLGLYAEVGVSAAIVLGLWLFSPWGILASARSGLRKRRRVEASR